MLSGQTLLNYFKQKHITTTSDRFYAHGKLLISGEYFVLDGAKALAIPTRIGQHLSVGPGQVSENSLQWESFDDKGNCWLRASFSLENLAVINSNDQPKASQLSTILKKARELNPANTATRLPSNVKTRLEFPLDWGLGSSSTLIYNISQWTEVDAFELLFSTLGGSGYDIACAQANSPVLYQLTDQKAHWTELHFNPEFSDNLYFVYLGKKQSSKEGIEYYKKNVRQDNMRIQEISSISEGLANAASLANFEALLKQHEELIAQSLKLTRAKDQYFPDFWGEVKSLGAWGGDFVLVTSARGNTETMRYFKEKQYPVVISFKDLIFEPA